MSGQELVHKKLHAVSFPFHIHAEGAAGDVSVRVDAYGRGDIVEMGVILVIIILLPALQMLDISGVAAAHPGFLISLLDGEKGFVFLVFHCLGEKLLVIILGVFWIAVFKLGEQGFGQGGEQCVKGVGVFGEG